MNNFFFECADLFSLFLRHRLYQAQQYIKGITTRKTRYGTHMVLCKMVKFHEIELSLERNKGGDEIFRAIHEGRSLG